VIPDLTTVLPHLHVLVNNLLQIYMQSQP